jgi:hypothetical protein
VAHPAKHTAVTITSAGIARPGFISLHSSMRFSTERSTVR